MVFIEYPSVLDGDMKWQICAANNKWKSAFES